MGSCAQNFRTSIFVLLAAFLWAGPAAAVCPPFPDVEWWQGLTHDKTQRYVALKHNGDWAPYVARWENQLANLQRIYGQGKAGTLPSSGVRLQGERLKGYINDVEQRVAVIKCLAAEAKAPAVPRPEALATGARGDAFLVPEAPEEAPEEEGSLRLVMTAQCEDDGQTLFAVVNAGPAWPSPARIVIQRTTNGALLAERSLRMTEGQTVTFRVRDRFQTELKVVPSWAPEDFLAAQARCF